MGINNVMDVIVKPLKIAADNIKIIIKGNVRKM